MAMINEDGEPIRKKVNFRSISKHPPTLEDAGLAMSNHVRTLAMAGASYLLRHNPTKKQFILTGAIDADAFKVLVPAATIGLDSRQQRYAELILSYE